MKQVLCILSLVVFLSSCSTSESFPTNPENSEKVSPSREETQETQPEIAGEVETNTDTDAITPEEEALLESLTEVRTEFDPVCVDLGETFFQSFDENIVYEMQTYYRKSDTNDCIVAYSYTSESGIYSYALYDLDTEKTLDEVTCEPEYDVDADVMSYCEGEDLDYLKLEYHYMLERNI